jgi:G3E family GTPase
MSVPVVLVAGFLGSGKTTVVNHLLAHAEGRRIAAVVNDFGAINIDAELILGAADGVVSLSNGCICCSLESDLLRTLAALLRRDPRPELIVIETSGVADPTDIVRNLMDPVIWREAPLETVLCVVDATTPTAMLDDALLRSQIRAADVVALSKVDLVDATGHPRVRDAVRALRPTAAVVDAPHGEVPLALLFPADVDYVPAPREPWRRELGRQRPAADRFETLSWTSEQPVSLPRLHRRLVASPQNWRGPRGCSTPWSSPAGQWCFSSQAAARRWPQAARCLRECHGPGWYSWPRSAYCRAPRSTRLCKDALKPGRRGAGPFWPRRGRLTAAAIGRRSNELADVSLRTTAPRMIILPETGRLRRTLLIPRSF